MKFLTYSIAIAIGATLICGTAAVAIRYPAWGWLTLLGALGLVVLAARMSRTPRTPKPTPARRWHVWDDDLDTDLSHTERAMLRGTDQAATPTPFGIATYPDRGRDGAR